MSAYALNSDDPNTLSCIMLRAATSAPNTNFVAYTSNGAGASTIVDFPVPVAIDTNYHTLEIAISADGTSVRFTLDAQSVIVTTTLPAVEQDLGFECRMRTLDDAAKSFRYYGAQIIQEK
jgi:beta-glucanase (GH16 family)